MKFYGEGIPGVDAAELAGKLIVIEGADGSGRSTQIDLLRDCLEREGHATVNVGLQRSTLVAEELNEAKQGNILGETTRSIFYATDFADQLENRIIPALRAGFIVLGRPLHLYPHGPGPRAWRRPGVGTLPLRHRPGP